MASDTITRFMDKEGWFTADSAQAEYSMVVDISGLKVKPGVEGFERSVRAGLGAQACQRATVDLFCGVELCRALGRLAQSPARVVSSGASSGR